MILSPTIGVNIVLNLYNIAILTLIIIFLVSKTKEDKANSWFILCSIFLIIFSVSDTISWITDGQPGAQMLTLGKVSMFIFYMTQPFMFISFLKYMNNYLKINVNDRLFWIFTYILAIVYLVFLLFTPAYGLFYFYDSNNNYIRGPYQFISVVINGIYLFSGFVYLILYRKKASVIEFICFFFFYLVPTISEFVQLKYYGLSLIVTGLTIPLIFIFMNLHNIIENHLAIIIDQSILKEKEIISIKDNTILGLSNLVENRDKDTGNHVKRIMKYVELLSRSCIKNEVYPDTINEEYVQRLIKAVPMHDIGKIVVPDEVLSKKGQLSSNDIAQIQKHVTEGAKIVKDVLSYEKDRKLVKMTENVVLYHHEKWDGSGYPKGLKSNSIPLSARIMAIADVFDALVTSRIYKEATLDLNDAFLLIKMNSEKSFDPELVKQFCLVENEFKKIVEEYGV